jgi:hypothetical protein
MIKINVPIETKNEDILRLEEIFFIYQHSKVLKTLRPETYSSITKKYGVYKSNLIKEYDSKIRAKSSLHRSDTSYIHAELAGFSKNLDFKILFSSEHETYYFKMTRENIDKSIFYIKDLDGSISSIGKGFISFANAVKKYSSNVEKYSAVCISIPFKVKPVYYLPRYDKRVYYHGSTKKLDEIKKWSYVTPYKEDAISFAVPWSSNDLVYTEHETSEVEGRPPMNLCFKSTIKKPRDRKIYLYEVLNCKTISAKTNTGKEYPWNRVLLKEQKNFNTTVIDSWKKHFKLK